MIIKDTDGDLLKLTTKRLRELNDEYWEPSWAVTAKSFRTAFRYRNRIVTIVRLTSTGKESDVHLNVGFSRAGTHGVGRQRIGCRFFEPTVFKTIVNALVYGKLTKVTKRATQKALATKAGQ
jgi:hypothetical protein